MDRTLVFTDIHGCHAQLVKLLARAKPRPGHDRLVFLGDYVNRGPASSKVIELLIDLGRSFPGAIFLKGNHEVMLLDFLRGVRPGLFRAAGGEATLQSYAATHHVAATSPDSFPADHLHFLRSLLPWWSDNDFLYVHAGLDPNRHPCQQTPDWLYWADRDRFFRSPLRFGKRVIFGHFHQPAPLMLPDRIGIDCGAVYGGCLACLILPAMSFLLEPTPCFFPLPPGSQPLRSVPCTGTSSNGTR